MKKILLSTLLLALPILANAYDIAVENDDKVMIYYNYCSDGKELSVTSGDAKYSGSVVIPEIVTYMGITRKVTCIGSYAFYNCTGLTSVTIPNSVTSIDYDAFEGCSSLTSVTIPNSVTNIENFAFLGCSSLTSVTIPNSATSIGNQAFYNCSGLTSVTIPNSVTSIGQATFYNCSNLTSVTIPNSVTSIGNYAFYNCSSLISVTIPNSVTSIGSGAFEGCNLLKTFTIPENITMIRKSTFQGCSSLTEIVIPAKVEYVYAEAFAGCRSLKSVTCLAITPPYAYDNTFSNYNIPLYVPDVSVNSYQETNPWSKFSELKTLSGDPIDNKCATPTISYSNKRLTFSCATENVEYVYKIKDTDIKNGYGAAVDLSATYEVSVYATKSGYVNSDMATDTLVWTEAIFTDTTPETPSSAKAIAETVPVLISANNGNITVKSEANGQAVAVYTVDGQLLGNATVSNGQAIVSTTLQNGNIAVVNVGNKAVKIVMR